MVPPTCTSDDGLQSLEAKKLCLAGSACGPKLHCQSVQARTMLEAPCDTHHSNFRHNTATFIGHWLVLFPPINTRAQPPHALHSMHRLRLAGGACWLKLECQSVHAVAQAGRWGSIIKHVA
jgi:hypothetical protein